jgi:HEAT repeat protein
MTVAWPLALLLAAAAASGGPQEDADREVSAIFVKIDQLVAQQAGVDARTAGELDRQMESLTPAVLKWKWRAVSPLSRILAATDRSLKARLYALSLMGLSHDPLALPPIKSLLLDPEAPAILRAAAASDLPLLFVDRQPVRAALCTTLAQADLPEEVARQALLETSRLGCDEAARLEDRVKGYGLRPRGRDRDASFLAIYTLGRSRPLAAAQSLVRLLRFFPPGAKLKADILRALAPRKRDMLAFKNDALSALSDVIKSDTDAPATVVAAVPLLASLREPLTAPLFDRLLRHPDAEVVTVAAEALADLQFFAAQEEIGRILDHVHEDKRFVAVPGRPEPGGLIERLQAAQKRLR